MQKESPESNGLVSRKYVWCRSKEQRICTEVCQNNLSTGKCLKTKQDCKVRSKPMSEEDKVRLRSYDKPKEPGLISDYLIRLIQSIGRSKVSLLTNIPESTINHWIHKRNVPDKYRDAIKELKRVPHI